MGLFGRGVALLGIGSFCLLTDRRDTQTGLGKHGTGITSALRHTKTGVKSGKIIAPKQRANRPERPPPSRVVMLAVRTPHAGRLLAGCAALTHD